MASTTESSENPPDPRARSRERGRCRSCLLRRRAREGGSSPRLLSRRRRSVPAGSRGAVHLPRPGVRSSSAERLECWLGPPLPLPTPHDSAPVCGADLNGGQVGPLACDMERSRAPALGVDALEGHSTVPPADVILRSFRPARGWQRRSAECWVQAGAGRVGTRHVACGTGDAGPGRARDRTRPAKLLPPVTRPSRR